MDPVQLGPLREKQGPPEKRSKRIRQRLWFSLTTVAAVSSLVALTSTVPTAHAQLLLPLDPDRPLEKLFPSLSTWKQPSHQSQEQDRVMDREQTRSQKPFSASRFIVQDPSQSVLDSTDFVDDPSDQEKEKEKERELLEKECLQHLLRPPYGPNVLGVPIYENDSMTLQSFRDEPEPDAKTPLRLWYKKAATSDALPEEGLVVGNGQTQVLVGGGINVERLLLHNPSCWSGGPHDFQVTNADGDGDDKDRGYRGGNIAEDEAPQRQQTLKEYREKMVEKHGAVVAKDPIVKRLMGKEDGFGAAAPFGELVVEELHPFSRVSDYRRQLDLATGVVNVTWTADGVSYSREHYCSAPDSVCVMRIRGSKPKSVNIKISLWTPHEAEYTNVHNKLGIHGHLRSNNLTIDAQAAVKADGASGVSMSNSQQVILMAFDTATVYYSTATGWNAAGYPGFEDKDPHDLLSTTVTKASEAFLPDLLQKYTDDYSKLYNSFELRFDRAEGTEEEKENVLRWTTDELLQSIKDGHASEAEKAYFDMLMVQYSRYLLIAMSRPGSLPISGSRFWTPEEAALVDRPRSGYKMDIDLQMNYWMSETTGLGETVTPLIDYMEQLLLPRGQDTAYLLHNARGWTTYPFSNIWAHTGPMTSLNTFYFPAAAAWLCQHAWDHYLYTQDASFLKNHAYKLMKGASEFWIDSLVQSRDNETFLISSPSHSPEHGPFTEGAAVDQQLVWQLFNTTLEAASIAGERDKKFLQELTDAYGRLSSGLKIGVWGQLQEWLLDLDDPNENHHHLAPFYAIYPGRQAFSIESGGDQESILNAARVALQRRGDGSTGDDGATIKGWPKTWRAALWARLEHGEEAVEALEAFKRKNINHSNLLTNEELSGQFGYGAAILELLVQDRRSNEIRVWTTPQTGLPKWWVSAGNLGGYRTRDGHAVAVQWKNSRVETVEVMTSNSGNVGKSGPLVVVVGTLGGGEGEEGATPTEKIKVQIKDSGKAVLFERRGNELSWVVSKSLTYLVLVEA